MCKAKEKVLCKSQPEQLDLIRRWHEALEGSNKELAYEVMNQVLDGEITNEAALEYLESIRN